MTISSFWQKLHASPVMHDTQELWQTHITEKFFSRKKLHQTVEVSSTCPYYYLINHSLGKESSRMKSTFRDTIWGHLNGSFLERRIFLFHHYGRIFKTQSSTKCRNCDKQILQRIFFSRKKFHQTIEVYLHRTLGMLTIQSKLLMWGFWCTQDRWMET